MKRFLLIFIATLICSVAISQSETETYKLKILKLDNGLTVYLNEDSSVPNVLGAVVVKTGAKYDPPDATGTAHYLEHMLFKGTDKLGTVDYKSEKIHLNRIAELYDILARTETSEERDSIQREINNVSLKAGKYAIPNELDKVLDEIGSTMVNAFTSDEVVAYFNVFPQNQMKKWLAIYAHRFKNPVFRLFQSELETVFEEKNMYDDNFITAVIETFYENFYRNHPYGQQTILGQAEHIRNPSLNVMRKMYETYYVPNNMALILSGNFNTEEVLPYIQKFFGEWKEGRVPEYPEYKEEPFDGVERVRVRLTPVRVGLMGFRTIPKNHPDELALEVAINMLSNSYSTGYLDRLSIDNKLMEVVAFNDVRNDHGALMVLYVPKLLFQSFNRAENLVLEQILRLRNGDVESDLLNSVKLSMIKQHHQSFENVFERTLLIAETFYTDKTWEDIISYPERIMQISEEHIHKVAYNYLGENYLSFQSKMGFPRNERLQKPGYDPIIPDNENARSEFARKIQYMKEGDIKPEFLREEYHYFVKNLEHSKDLSKLYYVQNDINDIFNLKIKFHSGDFYDNRYPYLAQYIQLIGTENYSLDVFNEKLQSIACSFSAYSNDNFFIIELSGFDKYLEQSLNLIAELLKNPVSDRSKQRNLRQMAKIERRFESRTPDQVADALFNYGIYGENSKYLRRMTVREVRRMNCNSLLDLLSQTIELPYHIHYSGSLDMRYVEKVISNSLKLNTKPSNNEIPVLIPREKISENKILFVDDSRSLQSRIYFYIEGEKIDGREIALMNAFNRYFGTGMTSLIFQEIREFRSMAYAAYGRFLQGNHLEQPGYLQVFVGTQADKTAEAVETVHQLITDMPRRENRVDQIRTALIQSINNNKPEKRNISETVENWHLLGIKKDPRMMQYEIYNNLDFVGIMEFYRRNVARKPILITIVGDSSNVDMDALSKFGEIEFVKKKDIFN